MTSVVIALSAVALLSAQGQTSAVFLNSSKPGVYVTFLRVGRRDPVRIDESKRGVFLRLHNNTRWVLLLHMSGVPRRNGEAGLFYDVVEDPSGYPPSQLPIRVNFHVSSVNPIRSGTTIDFSVPEEHIREGLGVQIEFNYEWEATERTGIPRPDEPRHVVTFYHSQLPETMRRGERRRPSMDEPIIIPQATPTPSDTPTRFDTDHKKK